MTVGTAQVSAYRTFGVRVAGWDIQPPQGPAFMDCWREGRESD